MQSLSHHLSLGSLCTIAFLAFSINSFAQLDDPFQNNNFDEDMGIWSESHSAEIVPVSPNDNQNWLLLHKGLIAEGASSGTDPYISTSAFSLNGHCGATLSFDLFALGSETGELIYIEVSSDNGKSFQVLREVEESIMLESGKSFNNGIKSKFSFPMRSFTSDSTILRINSKNLSNNSKIYLDNINLFSTRSEEYLLAIWQMGQVEANDIARVNPEYDGGNCSNVVAYPLNVSPDDRHYGIPGFTYEFLQEPTQNIQANRINDGGLCIDLKDMQGESASISFSIDLMPAEKGAIASFEFMEQAPLKINGKENNFPTAFDLSIYKNGELLFSQLNIPTTNEWSDRTFRLSHIQEFEVNTRSQFTFTLTPRSSGLEQAEHSVWFVDEVKILGGCCDFDCTVIEVEIEKEKTEEGLKLTPIIDDSSACLSLCSGSVTNEGSEFVSVVTQQSTGWSYYNSATTVDNSLSTMPLPETFDNYSLKLSSKNSQAAPYLETDVINLCPDEVYSVCFDHLKPQSNLSGFTKGSGLCVELNEKCKTISSSQEVSQACMSFKAKGTNHKLKLMIDEKYFSSLNDDEYYLDNVIVDHIPIEERVDLPVDWENNSGDKYKTEVPEVDISQTYTFKVTGAIDSTSIYKKSKLYSLCFEAKVHTEQLEYNNLNLKINRTIGKEIILENSVREYCVEFFSEVREHSLEFSLANADGILSTEYDLVMKSMVIRSNEIIESTDVIASGVQWTLPDGSSSSDISIIAEQNGQYSLEFTNCLECSKVADYNNEIDIEVCPDDLRIYCGDYLDPLFNSRNKLKEPDSPYSIGSFSFEDHQEGSGCLDAISRIWTVERLFKGEIYDTATCIQHISVVDNDAPQLSDFEITILSCNDLIPEPKELKVLDDCTKTVQLTYEQIEETGSGCPSDPIVVTRYWTAIDACGNTVTKPETFRIVYDLPSVTCPEPQIVLCESDIIASSPEVLWNCEALETSYSTDVNLTEGTVGCNGAIYEMTYTVVDGCGRSVACVQTFHLQDQSLTAICPSTATVRCIDDFVYGYPTFDMSCSAEVELSNNVPALIEGSHNCTNALYQVVYTIENYCGYTSDCTQDIIVSNTGLAIICPPDQVVTCPSDIMADVPTINQICNLGTNYGSLEPTLVLGIAECNGAEYELVYVANDDCENQTSCAQKFTIDNSALTITCPPDLVVQCLDNILSSDPEIFSNCESEPEYNVSNPMPLGSNLGCNLEVYELEYTGTNVCGDVASCVQTFTLNNTGLTMTCPNDQVVNCFEDIVASEIAFESACGVHNTLNVAAPVLQEGDPDCNEAMYNLLYELTDVCGNYLSCLQSFTLDVESLTVECPQDKLVLSFDEVQSDVLVVDQPCGLPYELTISQPQLLEINCDEAVYNFTYVVENDCSEVITCEQIVTLSDEQNAIDSDFICSNQELFLGLDCDEGGINDTDECGNGTDIENPCDDVTVEFVSFDAMCFGDSNGEISIMVSGGNPPYEFSLDSINWTLASDFLNLTAGSYVVNIRSTHGPECYFNEEITISEPPLSEAEAGDDQEVCLGYSANLMASGGNSYVWSTGETSQSITVSPIVTTTYTVTVSQASGCYNTDQVEVVVNQNNSASAGTDQQICIGYSANLEASGGVTYLWSTGDTSAEITVSPSSTVIYYVTVTDANGCTDTAEQEVIVNSNTEADAGTDVELCLGEEAELVASGGVSYIWSTGETTALITVTPSTTQTYTVTTTDANGCTDIAEVEVLVNPLPPADASTDQAICLNESTTLTASGGTSYLWSNSETTSAITVAPASTTNYTVTVTDDNGCTATAEVEVIVNPLPEAELTGDDEICLSYSTTLSASGGTNYLWNTGETTQDVTVSPSATSMYYVTVTDANGCTDMAELEVIVNSNTEADAGTDVEICLGEEAELVASGGVSYIWSTGETTALITVTPSITQTYTVTATDANGCTDIAEVEVLVNPLPPADASTDQAICLNESTTLTASGGTSYLWNNSETTSAITVAPASTTTYTVTVTDDNGCTATAEVEVIVNPLPEAELTGDDEICLSYSTTLSASGGTNYLWNTGETTPDITVTPSATSMYYVTVTDANGCTDTAEQEVIVNSNTEADAGTDVELCLGEEAELVASGGVSYIWSTGETTALITVTPSTTQTYTVTTTDANGCTDIAEVEVIVNPLPPADAGTGQAICLNESATLTATGGTNYLWSTLETTSAITVAPASTTNYTVTVSDANGCTATAEVEVIVNPLPEAELTGDDEICLSYSTTLSAAGGTTYLWSTGETTPDITVSPSATSIYYVTVTDANGCTDTAEQEVIVNSNTEADAGTDVELCLGEEAELVASGGVSYIWSTGETTSLITVTPSTTQTYTVTTTDANGCTDIAEVEVLVNPLPPADASTDQAICLNESTTLTASGGTSYLWNNSETTSAITVAPASTTTYTVTVTDDNGCTATAEVEVIVNPLPEAELTGDDEICLSYSTTLSASGGTTYLWITGETTQDITVSPSATSIYYVTVTDASGCTDTAELEVIVNSNTEADAGSDVELCLGEEAELVALGGVSYIWSTGETTALITVIPNTTQTYTVTTTDANGCTDIAEIEVIVNPLPPADAGADQAICLNESATLTATGGTNYLWSTLETTSAITVAPASTTNYTVTVSDANGCTATAEVEVIVNPLPEAELTGDDEICLSYSTTLSAAGGTTYLWSTGETTPDITVSPSATSIYYVTVTDANGCTDTAELEVIINSNTEADAGSDVELCLGEEAELVASGGDSFVWSTGETTSLITVTPSTTQTYTVTTTDANGCTDIAEVEVLVNPLPPADASTDQAICLNESTTLTASGGTSYLWNNSETTSAITVAPASTTTYTVTVTDDNGCTATAEVEVIVNPLPEAELTGDDEICLSYSTTLSASGGITYLWNTGETTQDITVSPSATSIYYVTVTDANGCTDTAEQEVIVNSNTEANAGSDVELCLGEEAELVASGGVSYIWSTGETTALITVTPSTTQTYTVTATDANGCTDIAEVEVLVNPLPPADAGTDQAICLNESTTLIASGGTSYQWSNSETTSAITVAPASTTNYTVTVTDDNGCTATAEVEVIVNPLPEAELTGDDEICLSYSTTLSASGGTNYLWNTGETTPDITVTPSATSMYYVTVTDANGCTDTAEQEVIVNSNTEADAGTDVELCLGEEAELVASGGVSYIWSTGETTALITVTPSTTQTYTVTTTDANGCTDIAEVEVLVNPLPPADASTDQAICLNESTTLTASGGTSYLWSNSETTSAITVAPASTTNYTVTVTDDNGCTATAEVEVIVNPLPEAELTGDDEICLSYSTTLSASGGTNYLWNTGETTQDVTVSPSATSMYYVTVTDANGCTDMAELEVIVNSNTEADAGTDVEICLGEEAELVASGGVSYIWSTGETTALITVTPSITQTYTVTATDANGCTDIAEVEVLVNPLPPADAGTDQAICLNESTTLTASGGTSYLWNNSETTSAIAVAPASTTTYTVTVTDDNGCTATAEVEVIVNPLPEAELTGDDEICLSYSTTLSASGGTNYLWNTGETTPDITVTPSATSMYYVTVTDANGCTDTAEQEVIVNSNTEADAGTDVELCLGEEAELVASGGVSYIWSTGETTALITVTPSTTQTYTVTTTDANGCTDVAEVEVIVNPLPPADAGTNQVICLNESATLTASGGASYVWSNSETSSTITVTPSSTTNYTVTVTDDNGCTATAEVEVVVNPLPEAELTGAGEICLGYSTTLSASGGTIYLWNTGETTQDITVSPSATSIYYVTVTDANGCTDTAELEVIVNSNTEADAGSDVELCLGEEAELVASGGVSYIWSTGETTALITVTPSTTQTYTVTATDANGCTDVAEVEVLVNPLPPADAGTDQAICLNESTTLTASGGTSYLWNNSETTSAITVAPASTTTYTVTVTDDNGCTATAEVEVIVNPLPEAELTGDDEICLSYSTTLSASGGTTYLWITGETTQDITVSPSATSIYYVTVTDANGCTDTAEQEVIVNSNTEADAGSDVELCLGEEAELVVLGGVSYIWSTGETTALITVIPSTTQTYTVTTTDANGCTDIAEVEVIVNPLPPADAGTDQAICLNESTTLIASGGTSYLWSNSETTSAITVAPASTTNYTVTVTDDNGCTATAEVEVIVNPLPEAELAGDDEICLSYSTTLSASGGITYLWNTGETTQDITVTPSATSIYYVTVTDANGCTDTAEQEVIVNSNTQADAGFDVELCLGEEAELVASGGVSYIWSTGETTALITVTPSTTQTYTVTTTDANGCTDIAEVEVLVNPLPPADASTDQAICLNESAILTASGGTSYLWSTSETGNSITVIPNSTTSYTVTVTDDNGCTATAEVAIVVFDLPTVETSADIAFCFGESTTLTATGGIDYLWSTGETEVSITATPTVTTTYSVTVTDENGCTDTGTIEVMIYDLPVADAGDDQNLCIGNDLELVATGGDSYLWNTGHTSSNIIVQPTSNTTYTVTVTDDNGCTDIDEVDVFVHDYPVALADPYAIACGANGAILTASGGTVYLWSTGATTATVTVYPSSFFEIYTVTVSNDFGCSDETEVPVYYLPSPPADAGPDQEICPGESVYLYGYGGDEYLWLPDLFLDDNTSPFPVSTPDSTITYTMIVTDESGCTASDQITITVIEDTIPPIAQCYDLVITANINGQGFFQPFELDDESYDNCTPVTLETDVSMFACVLQDYTVTLTVTDAYGNSSTCESTVTLEGPDGDCDFIANGCDLCDGGDDTIDNDNDGFPDCAYPPDSYLDVEDLWRCDSGNNIEEVWICHAPSQSICTPYDSAYLHLSYHNDDYLGPCEAIGCFYDKEVNVEDVLDGLAGMINTLKVQCKAVVTIIGSQTENPLEDIMYSFTYESSNCEVAEVSLSLSEAAIEQAIKGSDEFDLEFRIKDECGNTEKCKSIVRPIHENLGLYPNPTNDWLNVSGLENESYVIYNAKGERVTVVNYQDKIKVSYLEEGIYILVTNSGRSSRFVISGIH